MKRSHNPHAVEDGILYAHQMLKPWEGVHLIIPTSRRRGNYIIAPQIGGVVIGLCFSRSPFSVSQPRDLVQISQWECNVAESAVAALSNIMGGYCYDVDLPCIYSVYMARIQFVSWSQRSVFDDDDDDARTPILRCGFATPTH